MTLMMHLLALQTKKNFLQKLQGQPGWQRVHKFGPTSRRTVSRKGCGDCSQNARLTFGYVRILLMHLQTENFCEKFKGFGIQRGDVGAQFREKAVTMGGQGFTCRYLMTLMMHLALQT